MDPLPKAQRPNSGRADLYFIVHPKQLEIGVVEIEAIVGRSLSVVNAARTSAQARRNERLKRSRPI
jgi:hypothetical protein